MFEKRSLLTSILRGLMRRCPRCGRGRLFAGYLVLREACPDCALDLRNVRADDAPPYFTIFLVGHIVIPGVLWMEKGFHPEAWVHAAVWGPATLILTLTLLPVIKGAVVGAIWATGATGEASSD